MKTNLQFFAKDRTNMVSLLDIGSLTGSTEKLAEMGDGFTELTEDWGPNTESKQYVNMKNASNTVKGYAFSMTPSANVCLMICRPQLTRCSRHSRRGINVIHIITDFTRLTLNPAQVIAFAFRLQFAHQVPVDQVEIPLHHLFRLMVMEKWNREQSQSVLAAHLPGRKRKMLRVQDQRNRC